MLRTGRTMAADRGEHGRSSVNESCCSVMGSVETHHDFRNRPGLANGGGKVGPEVTNLRRGPTFRREPWRARRSRSPRLAAKHLLLRQRRLAGHADLRREIVTQPILLVL